MVPKKSFQLEEFFFVILLGVRKNNDDIFK